MLQDQRYLCKDMLLKRFLENLTVYEIKYIEIILDLVERFQSNADLQIS